MLTGPSGSGKSVLLELIAGLRKPCGGAIWLDRVQIDLLPPAGRSVGLLFQNYALFQHLSVFQNIGYALKLRQLPKGEVRSEVEKLVQEFEIGNTLLGIRPKRLE